MASVNSLSGSSGSSSIYGNRTYNIISGLASGLDTEELISGVVQSYQQKIQSLQQDNTKLQWQQTAIQSISDKLVEFDRNYSSYVYSNTNLASSSFFTNAVTTTANGTHAALVTASGKSTSEVILNSVTQLATAARYSVSGNHLLGEKLSVSGENATIFSDGVVNLNADKTLSNLAGELTLNYGDRTVTIEFEDTELFAKKDENGEYVKDEAGNYVLDADALQKAIVEKLSEQKISTSSGTSVAADTKIGVSVTEKDDGSFAFSFFDKSGAGNSVSIDDATGSLADTINFAEEGASFLISAGTVVTKDTNTAEYLAGKTITVTLDGKSKTIELPSVGSSTTPYADFKTQLQAQLDEAFGAGKVSFAFEKMGDGTGNHKLTFTASSTSTLSVSCEDTDIAKTLGIEYGISSYVNTTKTLGQLGVDFSNLECISVSSVSGMTKTTEDGKTYYTDKDGNRYLETKENGQTAYYRVDDKGAYLYNLEINGKTIGTYSENTEFTTIINAINNSEAGVNVSYSKTTGEFVLTAKETGSGGRVEIGDGLATTLFAPDGASVKTQAGVDARFTATINGKEMTFTRASNSFELDGMNVTISGIFDDGESVTFTSKTDTDTIVDAVKKMVEDLNTLIEEVKNAYSDMPLQKSDGSRYEPLIDSDLEDMSESAIEAYEEKAKTGILFMDSDLSALYNDLRNAITSSGADGVTLRSIGLSTSYSDGLTTLTLDEQALREALESDPEKVQQAFTKSKENGAATDGLMASLKTVVDRYASTTGDVKGILIEKAGSKYSPSAALDNTLLDQMKDIEDEISKWEDKMSNKVDYYTNKFTQLELLINQMNSQSSALAGLMGG